MRPLELRLIHFGPFRDEATLHFEALDRLFLVCGPTGAGKTTLFDALTYALYEKTSGTRSGLTDQLASHHAPEGSVPEVSLRFALGPQEWRVTRQLRHRVPKKKGDGWTERDPQVLLERRVPEGWDPVPGKRSEINAQLEGMLGLSAEEFAKIVVLPQGDFQRFLEASTADREKMLQKLFPVESYDRMVELLKARAKTAEEDRRRWEDRWQALTSRLEAGSEDRPALEAAWAEATAAAKVAQEEEQAASAELVRLRALEADWATLTAKKQEQRRLEEGRPRYQADRDRLEAARKTRPWVADLDRQEAILAEGRRLRSEQDEVRTAWEKAEADLAALVAQAEETNRRELRLEEIQGDRRLAEHQAKVWTETLALKQREQEARGAEDRAVAAWNRARLDREQVERALPPPLEGPNWTETLALQDAARDAEALARLIDSRDKAFAEEATAREGAATAATEEALWRQVVEALQAASLAQGLQAGAPCPVCGSSDHPHPAQWPEASAEAPARFALAQTALRKAQDIAAAAAARREALDARIAETPPITPLPGLEEAQRSLDAAEQRVKLLQAWMADQDKGQRALAAALAREGEADRERQTTIQAREAWTVRIQTLAQTAAEDPTPRLRALSLEEDSLRARLLADRTTTQALTAEVQNRAARVAALEERLEGQRVEYRQLQGRLEAAAVALGWTLAELKAARLEEAAFNALETGVAAFDRDSHRLEGEVRALESRFPEGAPPEAGPAVDRESAARVRREALEKQAKEKEFALRDRDRLDGELRQLASEKPGLEAEFQKLVPLARALEGHNGLNLRLTTWVLVQALEQVARSASHRLASMSGGRYALKVQSRGSDARRDWGLDLAVVDGYTGQERAVGTLSGGEKFMTSISLALGLADVIQERSGGVRLEAIFIDEGFGTLDDQSLDRAMAILHDLGQHRSVGIISHVAELRQRITSRVEVIKGKNGSHLVQ